MSQHFIAKALKAITIDTADATQKDILETAQKIESLNCCKSGGE